MVVARPYLPGTSSPQMSEHASEIAAEHTLFPLVANSIASEDVVNFLLLLGKLKETKRTGSKVRTNCRMD